MFDKPAPRSRALQVASVTAFVVVLAVVSGKAISAQDKYTLQVPNGLAFSEFKGYEDWQVVSVSRTDELLKVIAANPTMIAAYRSGIPGNGKPFPDGSKIAKIEWDQKKSTESPYSVDIPTALHSVNFIEKDSRRFPDTAGWAYATFSYNAASQSLAPQGTGSNCGFQCHTMVKAKDYIFTAYQNR